MPVYEYEHVGKGCKLGREFDWTQPITDKAMKQCPECGRAVNRLISLPNIATPTTDTELKSMGFTKLVKRDTGVYENVTRTGSESRYMEADKPGTLPDLKRKIRD